MGEPNDGASSRSAGAMDPPSVALDSHVDLSGDPPSKEPNAKITRKMDKQHASSSSVDEEGEEEEKDKEEEEEEDVKGGEANVRTGRRLFDDMFKYRGCSWPGVVGLKANKAKRIIRKGKPDIYFQVASKNQMLTMCYCSNRVRLIVDRSNCVVKTPHVG